MTDYCAGLGLSLEELYLDLHLMRTGRRNFKKRQQQKRMSKLLIADSSFQAMQGHDRVNSSNSQSN